MASVDIKKLHGTEAASILAHNHRHDGKDVEYRNKHIDKSMTIYNSEIRHDENMEGTKAHDEYTRLRKRIKEIDEKEPPKRIRKDRVTLCAFEVPLPEGLPPEREEQFFRIAYEEITRMCGGPGNVSSMKIHRDEVHDYLDPVTKEVRTSRIHGQVIGIPYVEGKGVNCKSFMTRKSLSDIQKNVDGRCRSELGIAFMVGSGEKSRGTVEDLKFASARAEHELAERIATQERILEDLRSETDVARAENEKARSEADRAIKEAEKAQELLQEAQSMGFNDQIALLRLRDHVEKLQKRYPKQWESMERAETERKARKHSRDKGRDRRHNHSDE